MPFLLSMAWRNTLRNSRRTALTAATVLSGTALLTVGLSWVNGIQNTFFGEASRVVGHVRVVTDGWMARERLMPLYENIPRSEALVRAVAAAPGVIAVYPRIMMGVTASKDGEEIGEVFGMAVGAPLTYYADVLHLPEHIATGAWFAPAAPGAAEGGGGESEGGARGQALVGHTLADQMGVRAGEEAIFIGQTQDGSMAPIRVRVQGIVDTGNGVYDKQIYLDLDQARWMVDVPEGCLELLVFGEDPADARALEAAVAPRLAAAEAAAGLAADRHLVAQAWDTREPFASMSRIIGAMVSIISGIIVLITGLGVLNTMLMSVLERTAEIGVLRAMGMRGRALVLMFITEALIISALGGAVGVGLGSIGSLIMESHGIDLGGLASKMPNTLPVNRIIHGDWEPRIALLAFLLGLAMALVGAVSPALRATRIAPVTAMRARR